MATEIVPRRRTMSLHSGLNQSAQQTGRYPFRSPAPPFHRRGTVSSNDAPHRRRRQALRPPASAACRTGTAPPRDAAPPQRYGRLGNDVGIPWIGMQPPLQALPGRTPQMLHNLLRGHRRREIQLHRPLTLLATGHGNNPSAQSPRKHPQPLICCFTDQVDSS